MRLFSSPIGFSIRLALCQELRDYDVHISAPLQYTYVRIVECDRGNKNIMENRLLNFRGQVHLSIHARIVLASCIVMILAETGSASNISTWLVKTIEDCGYYRCHVSSWRSPRAAPEQKLLHCCPTWGFLAMDCEGGRSDRDMYVLLLYESISCYSTSGWIHPLIISQQGISMGRE